MAILQRVPETRISTANMEDVRESDYNVNSPAEIRFFLNGIMQEKSLISLQIARNTHATILSSILAVDLPKKLLILDYGINETLNQMALKMGSVRCIASHNRIRIEFDCDNLQHIRFEGRNAFSVSFPGTLKRLQRRNFYRIETPVANPAICVVPSLSQDEETPAVYNLLDISCGGMALVDQPGTETIFRVGMTLEHNQVKLSESEVVETSIGIMNVTTAVMKTGNVCPRIGCEFVNLTEKSRTQIQRYIIRLEQQARKLESKS